ncbi:MAG TPA: signal peptidase II [Gemmatirosa sp.]
MSERAYPRATADATDATRAFSPVIAGALIAAIVAADQFTKHLAVSSLVPHVPRDVVGTAVRFTLTFNPGAAFGMHLGRASWWAFPALTVLILGFLFRLYRSLPLNEHALRVAIAAVMGGALGNLIDRFRSPAGVVDFIDVGVGDVRFWTFNVADSAVSVGAVLLVLLLWRYESRMQQGPRGATDTPPEPAEVARP